MKQLWRVCAVALFVNLLGLYATSVPGLTVHASSTKTFWVQVMDSCKQALPGVKFVLEGNGLRVAKGPTPGTKRRTIHHTASCPDQRGNCLTVAFRTGCLSWDIPIPASGPKTYKITESAAPRGFVPCNGGPSCPDGPEVATLIINSRGEISATLLNVSANGRSVTYPTKGAPYTGAETDPAVFHNWELPHRVGG